MKHAVWSAAESIANFIYIKFLHLSNNRDKYADGFYNFIFADGIGKIPTSLIIYPCTAFRHSLLEWEKNGGVSPLERSKLDAPADRNSGTYFNCKNSGGRARLILKPTPGGVLTKHCDLEAFKYLMNTRNALPGDYRQWVHQQTIARVKTRIKAADTPVAPPLVNTAAASIDADFAALRLVQPTG